MNQDELWMKEALRLAGRGLGRTSPNPMVGAVLVSGDKEVARGWHRGPGEAHAEIAALRQAGAAASGATLYLNLEPCAHHGRTPPCTDALVASGVARVVAACEDPDSQVSGRGFSELRAAGIEVDVGTLEAEARELNAAYWVHRSLGRTFVTYKSALSLDGRIAAADGSSTWLTGDEARRDAHRLRAVSDAICVGISTVLADDPMLTVREVRKLRSPLRVVIDSSARTPVGAKVLSEEAPTLIAVTTSAPSENIGRLRKAGAEVVTLPSESGRVRLPSLLAFLAQRGMVSMLLEGGGTLAGSFVAERLVDRYVFYMAAKLLGGKRTTGALEGWGAPAIGDAEPLQIVSVRRLGSDLKVVARPRRKEE